MLDSTSNSIILSSEEIKNNIITEERKQYYSGLFTKQTDENIEILI